MSNFGKRDIIRGTGVNRFLGRAPTDRERYEYRMLSGPRYVIRTSKIDKLIRERGRIRGNIRPEFKKRSMDSSSLIQSMNLTIDGMLDPFENVMSPRRPRRNSIVAPSSPRQNEEIKRKNLNIEFEEDLESFTPASFIKFKKNFKQFRGKRYQDIDRDVIDRINRIVNSGRIDFNDKMKRLRGLKIN